VPALSLHAASEPQVAASLVVMASILKIRRLVPAEVQSAIALWWVTDLIRPWNNPQSDVDRALATPTSTVLGGFLGGTMIATAMVGSDGHRGWVYYLAVAPSHQRCGFGGQMMAACEAFIEELGIPKIYLMVRPENRETVRFYQKLGYEIGNFVLLSKRFETED
jgi:ribosomal protein S18 acetylase RimI-like enzyme